jgi:hypothetical protein
MIFRKKKTIHNIVKESLQINYISKLGLHNVNIMWLLIWTNMNFVINFVWSNPT